MDGIISEASLHVKNCEMKMRVKMKMSLEFNNKACTDPEEEESIFQVATLIHALSLLIKGEGVFKFAKTCKMRKVEQAEEFRHFNIIVRAKL